MFELSAFGYQLVEARRRETGDGRKIEEGEAYER
jgi:hypothetical protein